MIFTTTESVPNREIEEILGVVTGNVVQTKHVGRDIMAGFKRFIAAFRGKPLLSSRRSSLYLDTHTPFV